MPVVQSREDATGDAVIFHFALVLDGSSSMSNLEQVAARVADGQVQRLATLSQQLGQETRATVYTFGSPEDFKCLYFDRDVLRLPSIKKQYRATSGSTALIRATRRAISDLRKTATLYGKHAFVLVVITDGQENVDAARDSYGSFYRRFSSPAPVAPASSELHAEIEALPDNWSVAIMVPDKAAKQDAIGFGFPEGNIRTWETTEQGMTEAGEALYQATERVMTNAAQTGSSAVSRNFFQIDTKTAQVAIKTQLDELHAGQVRSFEYQVGDPEDIAGFVESKLRIPYVKGMAYYELVDRSRRVSKNRGGEKVQPQKSVILRDRKSGKYYTGDRARSLLRLPSHEVLVAPPSASDPYDIYVESTSTNRKLVPGQHVLIP